MRFRNKRRAICILPTTWCTRLILLGTLLSWSAAAAAEIAYAPTFESNFGDQARARAIQCLTLAIAYEAGYEPIIGREAVAEVILNRVRNQSFPKSVCGVVFQGVERGRGCQFTFACDGALRRHLPDSVVAEARTIAQAALDGQISSHVAGATHYHAYYVLPKWAHTLDRVSQIGAHIFYRGMSNFGDTETSKGYIATAEPRYAGMSRIDDSAAAGVVVTPVRQVVADAKPIFAPWGLRSLGN